MRAERPDDADLDRQKAQRDRLFRAWVEAKRDAQESETEADHRRAAEAYLAFMRAHLSEEERSRIVLSNEVARLTAENAALRRGREEQAA